jgi:hypothetical protein
MIKTWRKIRISGFTGDWDFVTITLIANDWHNAGGNDENV